MVPVLIGLVAACSRGEDRSVTASSESPVTQAAAKSGGGPSFNTHLHGDQQVPPVATHATAQLIVYVGKTQAVSFKLLVANIENVTGVHIHCGARGVNGPIVASLYDGLAVSPKGTLVQGGMSEANIVPQPDSPECPGGVSSVATLVQAMRNGNVYADVHTLAHANGEIRGQID